MSHALSALQLEQYEIVETHRSCCLHGCVDAALYAYLEHRAAASTSAADVESRPGHGAG
jgi:hypothetical protein